MKKLTEQERTQLEKATEELLQLDELFRYALEKDEK